MTRHVWVICLGIATWVIGLAVMLYAFNLGKIDTIDGAQMITEVSLCDDLACTRTAPITLPYFSQVRPSDQIVTRQMQVILPHETPPNDIKALYLPKLTDNLDVWINDALIHANTLPDRLWNKPVLIDLPPALLAGPQVTLTLRLHGRPNEGLDLQPFFFGPLDVLAPYQAWRFFLSQGLARFTLGLMLVLTAALLVVWSFRRREHEYLWLGLACVTATGILTQFGFGSTMGSYTLSTLLWTSCASLYVLFILKFLRRFLSLRMIWPEHLHAVLLALACMVILISPSGYTFVMSMLAAALITVPSAFTVLVMLWLNRSLLTQLDMHVFFGCLSLSLVLGLYEMYLLLSATPDRTIHVFHLMPLVMSLACIWLILSRLIHSLQGYETLAASLNDTITQKSAELEASFAELTDIRRREAIAEERDRIMLDLHDGIGGQLVSTLAYMDSNHVGDQKVRRALEDALRDLALMLDSMENSESTVTLLGMLRMRLEGLLSEHGIKFDWQVCGEPVLVNPGPSQSLHLARIVQEAITNVIKHARANTIIVFVDETQIKISDNGHGFNMAEQASLEHPSNGIANMKRRCTAIGADFSMTSDSAGTCISLRLKKQT
ncbi:ATP-binding protein [Phaeobacter sp. C3_T13_0]|uniref:sensor histidine kinase n=1 Tax=Phaeobacter cretensis TaxID=3342641 RepID=UPI0039BCC607